MLIEYMSGSIWTYNNDNFVNWDIYCYERSLRRWSRHSKLIWLSVINYQVPIYKIEFLICGLYRSTVQNWRGKHDIECVVVFDAWILIHWEWFIRSGFKWTIPNTVKILGSFCISSIINFVFHFSVSLTT